MNLVFNIQTFSQVNLFYPQIPTYQIKLKTHKCLISINISNIFRAIEKFQPIQEKIIYVFSEHFNNLQLILTELQNKEIKFMKFMVIKTTVFLQCFLNKIIFYSDTLQRLNQFSHFKDYPGHTDTLILFVHKHYYFYLK